MTDAPHAVTTVFIYTICVDFITMVLSAYKLLSLDHSRSKLMNLLFKDGLIYFLIVLVSYPLRIADFHLLVFLV